MVFWTALHTTVDKPLIILDFYADIFIDSRLNLVVNITKKKFLIYFYLHSIPYTFSWTEKC